MSERQISTTSPYPFTPAECARLAAYRAAVAAGVYSDAGEEGGNAYCLRERP